MFISISHLTISYFQRVRRQAVVSAHLSSTHPESTYYTWSRGHKVPAKLLAPTGALYVMVGYYASKATCWVFQSVQHYKMLKMGLGKFGLWQLSWGPTVCTKKRKVGPPESNCPGPNGLGSNCPGPDCPGPKIAHRGNFRWIEVHQLAPRLDMIVCLVLIVVFLSTVCRAGGTPWSMSSFKLICFDWVNS